MIERHIKYGAWGFVAGALPNLLWGIDAAVIGGCIAALFGVCVSRNIDAPPSAWWGIHDVRDGDGDYL